MDRMKPGASQVDWESLRRRVAAASADDPGAAPDEARRILEQRAQRLARRAPAAPGTGGSTLVSFSLGDESWGLPADVVWAVFPVQEFARLPGAAAPVVGISPWHGLILPILDLRPLLGLPPADLEDLRLALVLGDREPALAALVDSVGEVLPAREGDVSRAPEGAMKHADQLLGLWRGSLPILDGARLVQRYR